MSAAKKFGGGTVIEYGGITAPSSTSAYAEIGLLRGDIKRTKSATVHDVTTHADVNTDLHKRKAGGLIDSGSFTFPLFADHEDTAGHVALLANVGKIGYFRAKPANLSPVQYGTFQAVIKSVSETFPLDGYTAWDVELDISGTVVYA